MACHHFEGLKPVPSVAASYVKGCEDCVKIGSRWVHLRECLARDRALPWDEASGDAVG